MRNICLCMAVFYLVARLLIWGTGCWLDSCRQAVDNKTAALKIIMDQGMR